MAGLRRNFFFQDLKMSNKTTVKYLVLFLIFSIDRILVDYGGMLYMLIYRYIKCSVTVYPIDCYRILEHWADSGFHTKINVGPFGPVPQANPPSYDRSEDLASLLYLNEASVMHSLRQRYGGNLIHTHAGPNIVIINPLSAPSMYSEKVSTVQYRL